MTMWFGADMRVAIICEFTGRVTDAFAKRGHYAISCDLMDSETPGNHYKGDAFDLLNSDDFDLIICHPPCTDLAVSGARHFQQKIADGRQERALKFVSDLMAAKNGNTGLSIDRICIENPISIISSKIRKPDQIIQPWQFGHGETKATCLWLKNLPKLTPTNIVEGREAKIHRMPPSPNRWKDRSRTYQGIADAMAEQWGNL